MPVVTQSLRKTWDEQRAQMLEEREVTQSGYMRDDLGVMEVDFDVAVLDRLLTLPLCATFDAQDVVRKMRLELFNV